MPQRNRFVRPLLAAVAVAAVPCAHAQDDDDWQIAVGAGAIYKPDYQGSDDYELRAAPYLSINWRDIVFLRGSALGVNALRLDNGFRAGALLRYQFLLDRDEDDNEALRGLGDIDGAVEAGVFAAYETGPWSLELALFQDVSDTYDGTMAELDIGYGVAFGDGFRFEVEASTTWADDDYLQTYFGISPEQSLASGRAEYVAEGGFKEVGLSFGLSYRLSEHWLLSSRLSYERLLGDAADSPIVADDGSPNQLSAGAFLGYRF